MNKSDIFWQTYLSIEKEVIEVSKYIYITDRVFVKGPNGNYVEQNNETQLNTFSPHVADLLVNCCVQIESLSKELYFENGGEKKRGESSIRFDEDCLKLIDKKWETHRKKVIITTPSFNLTDESNRIIRPLNKAHKRQGTLWERAYQAVKHDRFTSLSKGSVKALIHALAALYLLNIYYRNDEWDAKPEDVPKYDYSMGSSVFSVIPPKVSSRVSEDDLIFTDSPYVVSYKGEVVEKIDQIQKQQNEGINEYLSNQPEINEPGFIECLKRAKEREEENPANRVMPLWELSKYRINKTIPSTLSFEERKELLIKSKEWNCWIYQNNDYLKENQLTNENIQKAIDDAGLCYGIQIQQQYLDQRGVFSALEGETCRVYISEVTK